MTDDYYDRAAILPGRSATRSKAPGSLYPLGAAPHYALLAKGSHIMLTDNEWYLDTLCALGAISIGYGYTLDAHVCSLPFIDEIEAAEKILELVAPWATTVQHVRTGSEATHGALMVARRATGRYGCWRLKGSYHGWHEQWQEDVVGMNWFEVGEVPRFRSGFGNPAAVIIEPPRWESYSSEWLVAVVDAARAVGALVIFDEMIYGGRWALGGAAEYWSVEPDLACFGKALGNGAPVGIIVGGDALAEHGTAVSGTFSGHSGSLKCVIDTLDAYYDGDVIDWMWERGRQLQDGLNAVLPSSGFKVKSEGAAVHQRIVFDEGDRNESLMEAFMIQMVQRKIIMAPYSINIMRAHSAEDINRVVEAAGESLGAVARQVGS